jgi:hypothetical protein
MTRMANEYERADHERDYRKHEPRPTDPDRICKALVQASSTLPEILGELHALHYYRRDMTQHRQERMIGEAREMAEKLLVSILAAEQELMQPKETADA